ncbi:MAG: NAD(P)/FAD-dependent oxidoreductase [Cytophagales bacterium]|nr:NAD(P)/FAD-dependent oxidoreductase [Armatimonadota bacterium]
MDQSQRFPSASPEPAEYDAIVVGGSYAGLSAAMQLARARRRILILDGGRPRNRFAPTSHGFFGQDGLSPGKMIETARRQVMAYPTVRFQQAEATLATREKDGFLLAFGGDHAARGKRLVLATGVKDDLPTIPGLQELWGTGVAHCPYCHGYEVADRKLAVLGVNGPAVHQALLLRDWSGDVTLLTNGGEDLTKDDQDRLRDRGVKIEKASVSRLIAKGQELEAVEFADGRRLPFGGMFLPSRWSLTSPLAEQLGCEIEQGAFGPMIKTDAFKKSTVEGIYAAGDAARAMHSATLASADGVIAGAAAHQSLVFAGGQRS